jgi:hypothetical protein
VGVSGEPQISPSPGPSPLKGEGKYTQFSEYVPPADSKRVWEKVFFPSFPPLKKGDEGGFFSNADNIKR